MSRSAAPARAVTVAWVATVLVALAGIVLTGLEWSSLATSDAVGNVGAEAGAIAYAALGALIVLRAGNLVGWFMLAEGAANAVVTSVSAYAILGVKAHPGTFPAAAAAGTLAETAFVLEIAGLAAIFLRLPVGPAALAPVASGRHGRPGADRPEPGLVRGQHADGSAARAGRHLADLPQPARGPGPPAIRLVRYPGRPGACCSCCCWGPRWYRWRSGTAAATSGCASR